MSSIVPIEIPDAGGVTEAMKKDCKDILVTPSVPQIEYSKIENQNNNESTSVKVDEDAIKNVEIPKASMRKFNEIDITSMKHNVGGVAGGDEKPMQNKRRDNVGKDGVQNEEGTIPHIIINVGNQREYEDNGYSFEDNGYSFRKKRPKTKTKDLHHQDGNSIVKTQRKVPTNRLQQHQNQSKQEIKRSLIEDSLVLVNAPFFDQSANKPESLTIPPTSLAKLPSLSTISQRNKRPKSPTANLLTSETLLSMSIPFSHLRDKLPTTNNKTSFSGAGTHKSFAGAHNTKRSSKYKTKPILKTVFPDLLKKPILPQSEMAISSPVPRLASAKTVKSTSRWKLAEKEINKSRPSNIPTSTFFGVLELAHEKEFLKAKVDISKKEISTKKQKENMFTKNDSRKIGIVLMACMIEAELPLDFYSSLQKSAKIKRVLNSFLELSQDSKALLASLILD